MYVDAFATATTPVIDLTVVVVLLLWKGLVGCWLLVAVVVVVDWDSGWLKAKMYKAHAL